MTKIFNIYLNDEIIFKVSAASETEALDAFAQYRSGYDTFAEQCTSVYFAKYRDAYAA